MQFSLAPWDIVQHLYTHPILESGKENYVPPEHFTHKAVWILKYLWYRVFTKTTELINYLRALLLYFTSCKSSKIYLCSNQYYAGLWHFEKWLVLSINSINITSLSILCVITNMQLNEGEGIYADSYTAFLCNKSCNNKIIFSST
jgi:hypothetical protein